MNEIQESLEAAINWIINSKIHNLDKSNNETFGSFNKYYDLLTKSSPYCYTEITGYAIELLCDLYERTNDSKYLENAKFAGEWIGGMQYNGTDKNAIGSFLECFYLPKGPQAHRSYSFDTAICIGALSDLFKKTGDNKFLRLASNGVQWLTDVMQNSNGSFKPLYNLKTKSFLSKAGNLSFLSPKWWKWGELPGCHHGKIALGLLKYYSIENNPHLLDSVRLLLYWLLSQQEDKGYFRVNRRRDVSFLHTHCYATEGLLYAYSLLKDVQFYEAGKKACDWLVKIQRSDGSIPSWSNNNLFPSVDSSAISQTIRLWSIMYSETGDKYYYDSIKKALKYLLSLQLILSNSEISGGFYLIEFKTKFIKYRIKRLYSWPTIFAIHALSLANDIQNRKVQRTELW